MNRARSRKRVDPKTTADDTLFILVLGFVGFVESYDLAIAGLLLVVAKSLTPEEIRWLAVAPTLLVVEALRLRRFPIASAARPLCRSA